VLLALLTVLCLGAAFFLAKDMQFLTPGPLTSAHGTIENCSACHTESGRGKLSWIHGLVAGDPGADSNACLTCHKMPNTAFNAHSASAEVLKQSTRRLTKIAAATPAPQWARAQSVAFPTHDMMARGLYCATCHQEHRGVNFTLSKVSNEQCHSCHVVKFDSFDGHHPQFENYPFKRRTPIIYDHAGHFGKHFPEVAKKDPARRVPPTCSSCHNSRADRRIMAVAPFEQTCSACHLDQITGKERVSGPKGIAFLALPGLDLQTLRNKNASIGEWPAASEAELTPFMKVMISRNERGRALLKTVDGLNLQDLTDASDAQIEAVTNLVWEIKRLFYALVSGKASDVLGDLNIGCGAKLSAGLVADLTASIPRDVVIGAYRQWLPNLGTEMANRPDTGDRDQEQSCWITTIGGWVTTMTEPRSTVDGEAAATAKAARPAQANQQTPTRTAPDAVAAEAQAAQPEVATRKTDAANVSPGKETLSVDERPVAKPADQTDDLLNPTEEELRGIAAPPGGATIRTFTIIAEPDGGKETPAANEQPRPTKAGIKVAEKTAEPAGAVRKPAAANARPDGAVFAEAAPKAADQTDDLLNPTEEELRGIAAPKGAEKAPQPGNAAPVKDTEKAAQPVEATGKADTGNAKSDSAVPAEAASKADANARADTPADSAPAAAEPKAGAAPVVSIESDVDPESWADYGGWYRQDYAIYYRPTGHKDKFIFSWLVLTGLQATKGDRSPAAAVFDFLTSKDAQGSCTKCHSVDDIQGRGRVVNFSPPSAGSRQGRFTNFIHEPHFGVLENRGCLTCHSLEKGRPYLQSYEQGNPKNFVSNFSAVKKTLCQTCHASGMARQDCLLCHKYHVNGVTTPTMNTRLPTE
jgi:hypothetical protein